MRLLEEVNLRHSSKVTEDLLSVFFPEVWIWKKLATQPLKLIMLGWRSSLTLEVNMFIDINRLKNERKAFSKFNETHARGNTLKN